MQATSGNPPLTPAITAALRHSAAGPQHTQQGGTFPSPPKSSPQRCATRSLAPSMLSRALVSGNSSSGPRPLPLRPPCRLPAGAATPAGGPCAVASATDADALPSLPASAARPLPAAGAFGSGSEEPSASTAAAEALLSQLERAALSTWGRKGSDAVTNEAAPVVGRHPFLHSPPHTHPYERFRIPHNHSPLLLWGSRTGSSARAAARGGPPPESAVHCAPAAAVAPPGPCPAPPPAPLRPPLLRRLLSSPLPRRRGGRRAGKAARARHRSSGAGVYPRLAHAPHAAAPAPAGRQQGAGIHMLALPRRLPALRRHCMQPLGPAVALTPARLSALKI